LLTIRPVCCACIENLGIHVEVEGWVENSFNSFRISYIVTTVSIFLSQKSVQVNVWFIFFTNSYIFALSVHLYILPCDMLYSWLVAFWHQ